MIINWQNFVSLLVIPESMKHRASSPPPHRMDAPDRHNGQTDKQTCLFVRPSVRSVVS